MSRTERRKGWTHCPDHDCEYCGQGKSRRTFNRKARHRIKAIVKRGAWWLT